MITKKMQDAINTQINAELCSAYLYLSMSMDAETKGLKGVANWMYVQWLEEQEHARILENYMNAQGAKVELLPITEVPKTWKNTLEMFRDALYHEKEVTENINKLISTAWHEKDFATISRLEWFITEQVEEEDSVNYIIDQLELAGDEKLGLYSIDQKLAERCYEKADPLED